MKIVVFGASGRTGLPLVKQALDTGHQVVAFVRDPAKIPIQRSALTVVQGDVMNSADVERAVTSDVNAVISVLAPAKESPRNMLPAAVENIVCAMKRQGVRRLIYMTGAGIDMPEDQPKFMNHVIKFALKTMAGDVLKSSQEAAKWIQGSGLDWTILRAPMLNDGPHTGKYRVGWVGVNSGPRLSRADAGDFLLKQVVDNTYLSKAPVVSN